MARGRFARGRRAWGYDQRSGRRVLLRELVRDGETGLLVTREEYDPRHPLEKVKPLVDPEALRRPSPDLDRPGYTVSWPTAPFDDLSMTNPPLVVGFHLAQIRPSTEESEEGVYAPGIYEPGVYE